MPGRQQWCRKVRSSCTQRLRHRLRHQSWNLSYGPSRSLRRVRDDNAWRLHIPQTLFTL
jgi:hypothetical protein